MTFSKEFDGKVALVTGGSSGIGRATAVAFAQAGAKVVIASRSVERGEQAVHEICARGGDAIFVKTDVSQAKEVEALVDKTVDIYGRLDCACNNAGIAMAGSLTEHSEEDWDRIIGVNLKGVWLSLKYEIRAMLKHDSGTIVNVSSISGLVAVPTYGVSVYAASKGGINALTTAVAIEYAKSGIRINAISPGAIETDMQAQALSPEQKKQIDAAHPIGRIGKPEEVAEAVLYLCSHKASFVTGHNLVLDGGYTAQ